MHFRALLGPVFSCVTIADDWTTWRGPQGLGITTESTWNEKALLPSPKIAWEANVGLGYSALCVKGDSAWTLGYADKQDTVYCLSSADGSVRWRYSYDEKKGNYAGTRSTPVWDNGNIYTISRSGKMFCFEAATGTLVWQKNLDAETNARNRRWGIACSAIVRGDRIYLNLAQYGLCLNKNNGDIVWQSPEGESGFSSSIPYSLNGKDCLVNFGENTLHGVNAQDGKLLWSFPWATRYSENSADPIATEGQVFVSSVFSMGCARLDITGSNPKVVWKNRHMENKFGSTILYQGHLYGIHGNMRGKQKGILTCLDWNTGEPKWTHETDFGSLIIANGKLIVLNEKGILRIAEAAPSSYKELAQAQVLPKSEDGTKKPMKCWTAPVLANGFLYCRNDQGRVVCIDMR